MRGWETWIFLGTSFHGQGIRVALGVECDEDAGCCTDFMYCCGEVVLERAIEV